MEFQDTLGHFAPDYQIYMCGAKYQQGPGVGGSQNPLKSRKMSCMTGGN